ncbi:MAG: gamma-glutamyltransferase, partial [Clostridia bacterium]|nr:gamma-glutamyltransferase [Clostridia bacterium]
GKTGVPGFVLGMETVYNKYGSMDWGALIQPSIEYAENGFTISASFARHLQSSHSKLKSKYQPQFYNGSLLLKEGETIVQHDLAETYRLIQRYGSTVFYHGALTDHIISAVGNKLTQEDFNNYQVKERDAVVGTYMGGKIVSAPAPFSGTTLIQMLEIAERVELGTYENDIVRYATLMGSISSVTLKDRLKNICDPEYHTVPSDLLSEAHIADLTAKVASGNPEYLEPDNEHESTTHISIIDSNGMMVSVTNTLSDFFGYGVYTDGFFLNNTMKTSSDGVTARNYCKQGQRPRSFAMPTFIFGEDGSKVALGSSGGDRIPQVVAQIIIRYFEGEDLQEACDKPRLVMNGYLYWIEDSSVIDPDGKLASRFGRMSFSSREYFGAFNAVGVRADGTAFGASDQRRYGSFAAEETDG